MVRPARHRHRASVLRRTRVRLILNAHDAAQEICRSLYLLPDLYPLSRPNSYSVYSALPGQLGDFTVWIPGEGDNVVMCQQAARYLLRAHDKSPASCKYLTENDATVELKDAEAVVGALPNRE